MWRQNILQGNFESDQSISDEEEFENGDSGGNYVSLSGATGKEEPLPLQSRLEMLRDTHELNSGRKTGYLTSETTLLSKFPTTRGAKLSYKDGTRNPQNAHDEGYRWSIVTKETEALLRLKDNSSCSSSKANKVSKDIKCKTKPKFSFNFQSHQGLLSKVHEIPEVLETIDDGIADDSMNKFVEDLNGRKDSTSDFLIDDVEDIGHESIKKHSITELLDGLHSHSGLQQENCKLYSRRKGKRLKRAVKSSTFHGSDVTINNEEFPETMDDNSSNDDETDHLRLVQPITEQKRLSIADQFQEALGTTSLSTKANIVALPIPSGSGLFGKLQQVMQTEKQRDMNFLNKLQTADEESCIDVKILSRYFDAKLTVCQCTLRENTEESLQLHNSLTIMNGGKERTVIFNPKVCGNVELEVGNWIRIHPPWKEVQVAGNDENVVLSTYFSQMLS